jgi:hypothetical protein
MKTIEVEDEVYNKLIQLANEMTTQDPRGTRMPHIFQIRDWKKVYDFNLNGDNRIWVGDYETEIETFEELKEYLDNSDIPYEEEVLLDLWENDSDFGLPDWIEENCPDLKECTYSMEQFFVNSFLTAKSAEEHLRRNYYHYHKDADVYLNHAWRNPEAELVSSFLCGLVGKEMHT